MPNPSNDLSLPKLPGVADPIRQADPNLVYNNWLQSFNLPPGLMRLLGPLMAQANQQYETDYTNVYAGADKKRPPSRGFWGAGSVMPWGTEKLADVMPFWEWLDKMSPQQLYSNLTGTAGPGGRQQDLGFRKSRF